VRVGDLVAILLSESPTTGYRWAVDQSGTPELEFQNSDYSPVAGGGIGSGGSHTFTFVAKKTGTAAVGLKHWREWEGESSVTERFSVKINVT
jgi:inhibitor of cysteine peptidase